jgi:transaldolase
VTREIFIDTASIDDVRRWHRFGVVDGVTTNQKIFLAEGGVDFRTRILEICNEVQRPVSVELTRHGVDEMISEGLEYARWHPKIVVKVPMNTDGSGLAVLSALEDRKEPTNVTAMMTFEQMLLAARVGATYVSIFYNRALDAGEDPDREIRATREWLDAGSYTSKIIAGSIRSPKDVGKAYEAGADIITIPPKILDSMIDHAATASTLREFDAAWEQFQTSPAVGAR